MICKVCFKPVIRRSLLDYLSDYTVCKTCEVLEQKSAYIEHIPFFKSLLKIIMFPESQKEPVEAYTLHHICETYFIHLNLDLDDDTLILMLALHLEDTFYKRAYLTLDNIERITALERYLILLIH